MQLDFQKTAEEGVWFRTGGEIRGGKKKSVLYLGSHHWPCAEHGTVLLTKYYLGDQMKEADKCIQGFNEKALEGGVSQKTYAFVEW